MKLVRYTTEGVSEPIWGWLEGDHVGELEGSPFETYRRKSAKLPADRVRLWSPARPGKIVCVGRNYAAHADEHGAEVPDLPLLFMKPPSAVIGPGEAIELPPQSDQVEHEVELAIVVGRRARWVQPEEADDFILGYCPANDVTARDLQRRDGQWIRAKGFDTFCPLGPCLETEFDPIDALLHCTVNGQMRQMASTRDMIFSTRDLVAFVSSVMTLNPGDVILTGTPSGVGPLLDGDEVCVEVEGIGELVNPVRASEQTQ